MSNNDKAKKASESPMTFRAGGGGGKSPSKNVAPSSSSSSSSSRNRGERHHAEEKKDDANPIIPPPNSSDDRYDYRPPQTSTMACHHRPPSSSERVAPPPPPAHYFSVVRAGLRQKRSPLKVKNWISCLLTLDGRDKFTKVLQYTSRLLCWYFAGLANRTMALPGIDGSTGHTIDASAGGIWGAASLLGALYANLETRQKYYLAISKRFEELYKSLVTSRKAYRIGRSIIEWDKISSMGVGEYLNYMLLEPLADSPRSPKDAAAASVAPHSVLSTPAWKLLGTTTKLVGLMGFWAFDNASFVAGSGFLDPIISDVDRVVLVDPKCPDRTSRKNRAAEWASRFYFMGSVGGFYVNARTLWSHRRNELRRARESLRLAILSESTDDVEGARSHLEKTERDDFELCVALLKSIADVTVFSNNPGVDLHLMYRGKKNHEGLHCLGGLISASTVLYNNFPNA